MWEQVQLRIYRTSNTEIIQDGLNSFFSFFFFGLNS